MRTDGRKIDDLRSLRIAPNFTENPLASVLCEMGRTKVMCTVSEEASVPRFLRGTGRGWMGKPRAINTHLLTREPGSNWGSWPSKVAKWGFRKFPKPLLASKSRLRRLPRIPKVLKIAKGGFRKFPKPLLALPWIPKVPQHRLRQCWFATFPPRTPQKAGDFGG